MKPRELVEAWVKYFNASDVSRLGELYHVDAVDHQSPHEPVVGREAIMDMFRSEFASRKMKCVIDGIHEVGDVVVVEWHDPLGLNGCSLFTLMDGLIIQQRGYWDRMTAQRLHSESSD